MISKKTISFILKISIVFFSIYFLYVQFILKIEDNQVNSFSIFRTINSNIFSFFLVFFMMFLNWIIEAFKWKLLIKKVEDISFWTSVRAVFSGITVSTFTPNRVGEYGGRIFCLSKADRFQSILITVIGSVGQLTTTIFFGLFGLMFLPNYLPEILDYNFFRLVSYKLCIICMCFLNLCLVLIFLKTSYLTKLLSHFKFLNRFKKYIDVFSFYSVKELFYVFLLSNFRYLVFTTQFFILLNTFDNDILYLEAIPFYPAYPGVIPNTFNIEMMIQRGYWMVSWFKKEFGLQEDQLAKEKNVQPETLFDKLLAKVPPGSDGLMLQPYWSPSNGDGPETRGAIIGFNEDHTRAHLYRAMIEGLTYALRESKELLEKRSKKIISRIVVSGGGSQSDEVMQITADIFGMTVFRPHTFETSSLGAAIASAVGIGLYPNFTSAVEKMTHEGDRFDPIAANSEIYNDLYHKVYKKMYGNLKPSYEAIWSITNRT